MSELIAVFGTHASVLVLLAIALDVVSGLIRAGFQGVVSSRKMWRGLLGKSAVLVVMCTAGIVDYGLLSSLDIGIDAPIYETVCAYIVVMELVSVFENVAQVNPQLGKLRSLFKLTSSDETNTPPTVTARDADVSRETD